MQPLVSTVIATYNCSRLLVNAIDSALAQTYGAVEVIVVDDGSTDDTRAVCERFADRIKYVYRDNGGTSAARNTGLQLARGDFIAMLDQDDLWVSDKIERQMEIMQSDSRIGLVHTGIRVRDFESNRITSTVSPSEELDYHALLRWCTVGCASVMMRRCSIDGPFDQNLPGADDWDMWIRIAANYRVVGIPDILTEIREYGGNQGHRYQRMYPIALAVIDKQRHFHPKDCRQCIESKGFARRRLRQDYYVKACGESVRRLKCGDFVGAFRTRLDAIARYPEAVSHIPRRIITRLVGR